MKCPTCNVALLMAERHGVEINYCPDCRGVWLEKGLLDRIVEKYSSSNNEESKNKKGSSYKNQDDDDDFNGNNNKGKKGGFFSELLDF